VSRHAEEPESWVEARPRTAAEGGRPQGRLDRSGLVERPKFHDLRHCYATWLVSDGVPVNVVQAVMRHEQASTTLNRYTHVPADTHARVRAALNAPAAYSPPAGVRAAGDDR
jgi:integrase